MMMCLVVFAVGAAAQQPAQEPPAQQAAPEKPAPVIEGTIRVSGAWALYPMMVKWAEEFQVLYPKVRVDVSAGGAGKGIADTLAGLVDIGMVSREIRQEELDKGAYAVPVVKDAVFPTICQSNPVFAAIMEKGIKRQSFVDLFITGTEITWGQLAGTEAAAKVQVYTRSDSCGAAETWAKYLGGEQEDLKGTAVYGDPGLADAVKKDASGIGFNNLNFAYDMNTGLPVAGIAVAPIDVNENGAVDPDEVLVKKSDAIKAIQGGKYPSPPARDLYLVGKGEFTGPTLEFVKWILGDGQDYVGEVGYINLPAETLTKAAAALVK